MMSQSCTKGEEEWRRGEGVEGGREGGRRERNKDRREVEVEAGRRRKHKGM